MTRERVEHIAVVGDGIAAWTAAAVFARRLPGTRVTVVDAPGSRPAIGDRFATMQPSAAAFHERLGLRTGQVIVDTRGVFRLGTRFDGWGRGRTGFTIGHGGHGGTLGSAAMHQLWARAARERSDQPPFAALVPAAALIDAGRFRPPAADRQSPMADYDIAFATDAATYTGYLRAFAGHVGAKRAAALAGVAVDGDRIAHLALADGTTLAADLYIDASGPDARVLARLPGGADRVSWQAWLPVDRVRIDRAAPDPALPPSDRVAAETNGWTLSSQLSDHMIIARGYDSRLLRDVAGSAPLTLAAGRRERAWIGNCVVIGDAAVEIDPIGAPHMVLVQSAADRIVRLLPGADFAAVELAYYNREWRQEADRLRDFAIAAYAVSGRTEPFWRHVRDVPPPPELADRLAIFTSRGRLLARDHEVYDDDHWLQLLLGAGMLPERTDVLADTVSRSAFDLVADERIAAIAAAVATAPTHRQALSRLARDRAA